LRNQTIRQRMLATTMMGGAAILAVAALPVVALVAAPTAAVAQDYTNGTLTGTVEGTNGEPIAGATVTIVSNAQGVSRTATTGANGQFRVPIIPTGTYAATVTAPGFDSVTDTVNVGLGGQSGYIFTLGAEGASQSNVDDIVVTGVRPALDFARTTTGVTLQVDELIDQVPVARNITAITLLAPGAVPGDSSFAVGSAQLQAPAALGGSGPAENAYYVNGLNITNFVNGLGGAPVPFEFYKTVEIKTGGYSAEFGRATGAVINAVTKSGTNDFIVELHGTWAPNSLREQAPNTLPNAQPSTGAVNSASEFEEKTLTLEVGGPIIRDRLFAYGIVSWADTESQTANTGGTLFKNTFSDDPFYGVKLDGYITADHRLEFTYFNTEQTRTQDAYAFNPTTSAVGGLLGTNVLNQGGDNFVARYTGTITDWLTISAAYGETNVDQAAVGDLFAESLVTDSRTGQGNARRSRQTTAATTVPFFAERKFYRADADVYFDLFGQHHVRFGYDHEDTLLNETSVRNGGYNVTYRTAAAGNTLGLATGQEYIEHRIFATGGGFEGANEAYYVQDSWDVNDRLNFQVGFRMDKFQIQNPNGDTFINFDGEKAARLGFAYDPIGDARSKFFGSYGRYYLPPASNTAFRAASPATDITEFFLPSGGGLTLGALNATTGLPTAGAFGTQITNRPSLQACPANTGTNAAAGTVACSVRNNGVAPAPEAVSATNLASTYEDEFIIGYQNQITDEWTVGVSAVYRNLGRAVEDALLDDGVRAYCTRNNIAGCAAAFPGQSYYLIINPGFDVEASVILPNSTARQTITLNAEDLGLPKARREYAALEFTFERAFDGVWGLQGSYTLSKSEGNYEGGVKSDIGQTDSGITQDFDFLSFIPGSYGLLPNHRAHQFKAYGSWQATDKLLIGANLSVISPRHYGCVGLAPPTYANGDGDIANQSYGAASRFCPTGTNTDPAQNVIVDRGSAFEADWITRFDLAFRYSLDDIVPGNLVLRADIINVFNLDSVVEANEFKQATSGNVTDSNYMAPNTYQAPRSVRFGFDWAF